MRIETRQQLFRTSGQDHGAEGHQLTIRQALIDRAIAAVPGAQQPSVTFTASG